MLHSLRMKLEDLKPDFAEFHLSATNKSYRIRPISLSDELWMKKTFGDELEIIFKEMRMKEICRIVYHQLEDRSDFVKRSVKIVNEDGDEVSQTLGGEELLYSLVLGVNEKIALINALLQTIGISRPVVEKMSSEIEKKSPTQSTGL